MSPGVLQSLRSRRATIRERWEALLRVEPVNTPLALPDALAHLIPDSLDEIFAALAGRSDKPLSLANARKIALPVCGCNRNPYLSYFKAGEQAVLEALVLLQTQLPPEQRKEHDLADVVRVTRQLAASEIETFCSLCAHRGESPACRHYATAEA